MNASTAHAPRPFSRLRAKPLALLAAGCWPRSGWRCMPGNGCPPRTRTGALRRSGARALLVQEPATITLKQTVVLVASLGRQSAISTSCVLRWHRPVTALAVESRGGWPGAAAAGELAAKDLADDIRAALWMRALAQQRSARDQPYAFGNRIADLCEPVPSADGKPYYWWPPATRPDNMAPEAKHALTIHPQLPAVVVARGAVTFTFLLVATRCRNIGNAAGFLGRTGPVPRRQAVSRRTSTLVGTGPCWSSGAGRCDRLHPAMRARRSRPPMEPGSPWSPSRRPDMPVARNNPSALPGNAGIPACTPRSGLARWMESHLGSSERCLARPQHEPRPSLLGGLVAASRTGDPEHRACQVGRCIALTAQIVKTSRPSTAGKEDQMMR